MLQGIFSSNQGIVGDRVGDFSNAVLKLFPSGQAQFFAISAGMRKESTADTIFNWFEDKYHDARTGVVSGGTGNTVVVERADTLIPGSVLMVEETGEHMMVLASAGPSLTVRRGMAATTPVSLTNAHHIIKIGNAHEEGSEMPSMVMTQGVHLSNYVQIFRNSWGITGTAKAVKFRTGSKEARTRQECGQFHSEDIERALIWGRKEIGTLNNKPFRTTDGIMAQLENNGGLIESAASGGVAGQINLHDIQDWIRRLYSVQLKGQPSERLAYCGDLALQTINRCVELDSTYNIAVNETQHGIAVHTLLTPFGKLKLMTHPLMNLSPVLATQVWAFHPGSIVKKVLRDTFYDNHDSSGTRPNGRDADTGAMTSEIGVQVEGAATGGVLKNLKTPIANA